MPMYPNASFRVHPADRLACSSGAAAATPDLPALALERGGSTQTGHDRLGLFNYLVGAGEDQRRDRMWSTAQSEDQRLSSLQDAVDIASGAAKDVEDAGAVGDEQAPRRTRGRR
jgi:hypothetical protein